MKNQKLYIFLSKIIILISLLSFAFFDEKNRLEILKLVTGFSGAMVVEQVKQVKDKKDKKISKELEKE